MEIVYVNQRKRRNYGRQPTFTVNNAQLYLDIKTDPQYMTNYTVRNPSHTEVQCSPEMSEHEANTESVSFSRQGILHKEGGWPKDVDSNEVEHTLRFRKKVEKDEEYIRIVKILGESMEHVIKQNNAIDIYEEYFQSEAENSIVDVPSARTLNVYRDPNSVKRSVSYVSWYPEDGHKVATAYSCLQFQRIPFNMSHESYIWDLENPNAPDQSIIPSSPLVCLKYNPKDPHILVGGSYNGLVGYWDTRKGPYPADTSTIEKSHRDPVFSVAWIQSKTGAEFFSTSTDGQVLWWDIRKLSEPTESLILDPEKNGSIVGGTALDYEPTMPTKFMVASESGSIFVCNKKAKNPSERLGHALTGHHGPVYALQRNPFFPKSFLSVGDWTAKIWSEESRSPLMSTKYHSSYLTDGCWSTSRPAVFCTTRIDGILDFWDFVFKQNMPTLSVQVRDSPLDCVRIQDHGKLVAVGARDGSTTLIELSESLGKIQPNEKQNFSAMIERETKREKTLESAAREKRLKAQAKRPASGNNKTVVTEDGFDQVKEEFFKCLEEHDKPKKGHAKEQQPEAEN